MGYMGISIIESDMASDAVHEMTCAMVRSLEKELKQDHGQWNTPGCINVGLVFEEVFTKCDCFDYHPSLQKLAKKVIKMLDKQIELYREAKNWKDQKEHLARTRQIRKSVQKYLQTDM